MAGAKKRHDYQFAYDHIMGLLKGGRYAVSDKLPSIPELSKELKVGQISVQVAVRRLSEAGFLKAVRGSGTFIRRIPGKAEDISAAKASSSKPVFQDEGGAGYDRSAFVIRKKPLKISLAPGELPHFSQAWGEIFGGYARRNRSVELELVPSADIRGLGAGYSADIVFFQGCYHPYIYGSGALFDPAQLGGINLPDDEFGEKLLQCCRTGNSIMAVPVTMNFSCQFYDRDKKEVAEKVISVDGLWRQLEAMSDIAGRWWARHGTALAVDNNTLMETLLSADRCCAEAGGGPAWTECLERPAAANTLVRFGRYFRDRRIFWQEDSEPWPRTGLFLKRRAPVFWSNTCFIPEIAAGCAFDFGIVPQAAEKECPISGNAILCGISSFTAYPEDCRDILEHIASAEAQKILAEKGRFVANSRAARSLRIKGLDSKSAAVLLAALDRIKIPGSSSPYLMEYIATVLSHDVSRWQLGALSDEDFITKLRINAKFFFENRERQERADPGAGRRAAGDRAAAG